MQGSNDKSDAAISSEEEEAFVCDMLGEYNNESNDEGGCSALAWQVGDPTVICNSGASCHMSYSSTGMLNYRESNAYMRMVSCARYPIEGYGDLPFTFQSSYDGVPLLIRNVAYVLSLNDHFLSLRAVADKILTYTGNYEGVSVFFSTGDTLFFRLLEDSSSCTHIVPAYTLMRPPMQLLRPDLLPETVTPSLT